MLKISKIEPVKDAVILHLEGRVIGSWVAELRSCCQQVLNEGRSLELDLADVEFLDAHGVALLSSLRSRGVSLVECSPFVAEQLKVAAEDPHPQSGSHHR